MEIVSEFATHKGNVRGENQDSVTNLTLPAGEVFIVADGMGGTAGGKTASSMAIDIVGGWLKNGSGPINKLIGEAISKANQKIYSKALSGDPKFSKMGTTVAVLYISDQYAFHAHVGDTRIYLYRNNKLKQLTKDHSKVQDLIDIGMIDPEDAALHPESNVITRCLGIGTSVDVEVRREPLNIQDKDRFLICSDGLWGMIKDSRIEALFSEDKTLDVLCNNLIEEALSAGGKDNVTVQIAGVLQKKTKKQHLPKKLHVILICSIILVLIGVLLFL
nr:Stp1/IreP family PP2C-type Ser/Thr phosphatase [uncultured Desulfobacter sp.]